MMKSLIAGVLLTAPLLASAYTWDQTIDFNPSPKLTTFDTYTFTHDLRTEGFNPGVDSIADYDLTITLKNDQGLLDAFYIDQPGFWGDSAALFYNWTSASLTTGASYQGLASLNSDGLLDVSITSWWGTFYLASSELKASGTQGGGISSQVTNSTHAVPEPTSVALLAAGLLGIAVMRRNSNKNS